MNFPILSSLILLPSVGALFILITGSSVKSNFKSSRYVALFASFANFIISIYLWYIFNSNIADFQFVENRIWLKGFINYKVGIDGISILFIILTTLISSLCIVSVSQTIKVKLKEFLKIIITNNHYKKDDLFKYLVFDFIEFYFSKIDPSKFLKIYDKYNYFINFIYCIFSYIQN